MIKSLEEEFTRDSYEGTDEGHGKRLTDQQLEDELDRWYKILHAAEPDLYESTRFELVVDHRLGPDFPKAKRLALRAAVRRAQRLCMLFGGDALSEGERSAMRVRAITKVLTASELKLWTRQ